MKNHANWRIVVASKATCKIYNNVKKPSLFKFFPLVILTFELLPQESFHLMLGLFNHLWESKRVISDEHKITLHEFAVVNNCIKESYWGNTFKGKEW